jgi:hypothetical protein
VARLSWDEDDLLLRLNWLEKLGDLSLRIVKVPLTAIQTVEVVNDPHSHLLSYDIDIGFAGWRTRSQNHDLEDSRKNR